MGKWNIGNIPLENVVKSMHKKINSLNSRESLCCKGPQKNERRLNFLQPVWFRRILLTN